MSENINSGEPADENLGMKEVFTEKKETETPEPENTGLDNVSIEEETVSRFQEYFNEIVEADKPKMTDTLLTLHELRIIDEELTDIEDEKGDLPEKIDSIKKEIESLNKLTEEKKQSLAKLDEERTGLKTDNASYEERINKYDEQKFDVRSNKEYDEIVKTIEGLFEEVSKNEKRLKDIDEIHSMLSADIESLEARSNDASTGLTEKQSLLDELDEQYRQDESGLREKRNELLGRIDEASSLLYERINKSFKGEATAIVRKGNCSGCYNSIPPQIVIEIKSAEKLFTCQTCGRILISEELLTSKE